MIIFNCPNTINNVRVLKLGHDLIAILPSPPLFRVIILIIEGHDGLGVGGSSAETVSLHLFLFLDE